MKITNLFADIPDSIPEELVEELATSDAVRIERIISQGQASPPGFWYDQDNSEWVLLLKGSAGLLLEGEDEVIELLPGDSLNIPAHRKHRVEHTAADSETIWLAVYYT
jgi:cupin 2 domain-containing protein